MTVYLNLATPADFGGTFSPSPSTMAFRQMGDMSPALKAAWTKAAGQSLETWVSYFDRCPFNLTLSLVINPSDRQFSVTAGYANSSQSGSEIRQPPKASAGYLRMHYDMNIRQAWLQGANVSQNSAHRAGFLRHILASLQRFAEARGQPEQVTFTSTGAGVYTWASYGGTPTRIQNTAYALSQRWQSLLNKHFAAKIHPAIGAWISDLRQTPDESCFRSIFIQAADSQPIKAGLKTLLLGDAGFLEKPDYRLHDGAPIAHYDAAANDEYRFLPQDPQYRQFFADRLQQLGL